MRARSGLLSGGVVLLGLLFVVALSEPTARAAGKSRRAVASAALAADPAGSEGRRVFMDNCANCHGERGDGRSPMGPSMRPPAFDLTGFELSESLIWRALQQGIPGSQMPSWNTLADEELRAVVHYTAALGRPGELPEGARWGSPDVLQQAGRRVYAMHCTRCHGENGDGNGPDATRCYPLPANFLDMRPSYAAAKRAIRDGVPGTAMPAWPLLTEGEMQAVTYYLRSLYRWPEHATAPQPTVRPRTISP